MSYYDSIGKQWHSYTGYKGGAFKDSVLNDLLISKISSVAGCSILEIGAGNGYFLPLLLQRFCGEIPSRIVVSDASDVLLNIAQSKFRIDRAEYVKLDIRNKFPFDDSSFDLLLSIMVFNEISDNSLSQALSESYRVLSASGNFIASILHPDFVNNLAKRKALKRDKKGRLTMPSSGNLRVPVVQRDLDKYLELFGAAGFQFTVEEVFPSETVLKAKPGLRGIGKIPVCSVFCCNKENDSC